MEINLIVTYDGSSDKCVCVHNSYMFITHNSKSYFLQLQLQATWGCPHLQIISIANDFMHNIH